MTAYFITATGTGVGKTFATCAMIHAARAKAKKVVGVKPVISGWQENDDPDTAQLINANGGQGCVEEISPWRFAAPLSPHRAAALESRHIDTNKLVEWTKREASTARLTLIEGVGGVMVPLSNDFTTLDWMEALKLPVILVTGSYLGSISHTLTALAALRARNLQVAALILNESECSSVTLEEAHAGLYHYILDIPLRIIQPRVSSWKEASAIHALEL
ncbi:MAG: dethiobiotin synthase [Rickettsiales bacterium]